MMTSAAAALWALLSPPALAADPAVDNAAEADLHFQLGVEAYARKDYREALEHLLLSNRLAPNRNVVFNIARCYEQMGNFQQSYRHYADFVAREPDAQRRRAGEDALARIRPQVALLRVESNPPGATVYVDREDLGARGITPMELALESGPHTVILQQPGHHPQELPVELRVGDTVLSTFQLQPVLGTVVLQGEPRGARVHLGDINGPVLGTLPGPLRLPPGQQLITIELDGYLPRREVVTVTEQGESQLQVQLALKSGSLVVNAAEKGALIEVDGRAMGFTPAVLTLPAGAHAVRITRPGFRPVEQTVEVPAEGTTSLDLRMRSQQQVTAASRSSQAVEEAPASVSIITGAEIAAFNHLSVYEALGGTRGLFLTQDLSYGYVGVRGFARPGDYGNRIMVTMDGHTMNDDQIGASYVGPDLLVDLGDVERIEVVRGPGSALYGSSAFFGVINVVTRERQAVAPHITINGAGERSLRARAGQGFGDRQRGGWASAAVLGAQGDDHYFEEYDDGPSLTPGGSDHGLVVGAAGTRAWTGQLRLWSGDWKLQAYTNGRDHRYPTGAFGTLIGDEEAAVTDLRSYLELEQEGAELGPGLLQGRVWLDHYSFRGGYPYPGDYLLLDAWDGLWTGLEPRYRLALGGQGSLTLGLEGRAYVLAHLKSTDPSVVNEQEPTRQTLGAYAQAELRPADWFIGTLGARYDWTSLEEAGGAFNPRAALVFLAGEDDVIKAMGGTAFRAPSPYEWYYNDGGLTQVPPLSLAPERIATLELEHSHRFSEVITLTSAAWFNRISSLVDTELTGEVGEEGQIFRYANSEVPVRSAGSEVELRRDWAGGWMAAAQVSAQYTALEGEDQAFTNSPWLLSGFKVAAPLGAAGGLLASRLRVESPRATIAEQQTPWSAIWDLVWSGRISDSPVTASAGVYNLLDWRVEHPGGQDLRQDSIQQPGRTLGLSMTWTAPGAP